MASRIPVAVAARPPSRRSAHCGQGLAEYALILSLIVVIAAIALIFLGTQISVILSTIAQQL